MPWSKGWRTCGRVAPLAVAVSLSAGCADSQVGQDFPASQNPPSAERPVSPRNQDPRLTAPCDTPDRFTRGDIKSAAIKGLQSGGYLPPSVDASEIPIQQVSAAAACYYRIEHCQRAGAVPARQALRALRAGGARRPASDTCAGELSPQQGLFTPDLIERARDIGLWRETGGLTVTPGAGGAASGGLAGLGGGAAAGGETEPVTPPPRVITPIPTPEPETILPDTASEFLVDRLECRPPFEAYFVAYRAPGAAAPEPEAEASAEIAIDADAPAPAPVGPRAISEKHVLWFNINETGSSDEGWLCAPARRFCYGAVRYESFARPGGDRIQGSALSPTDASALVTLSQAAKLLESRATTECGLKRRGS